MQNLANVGIPKYVKNRQRQKTRTRTINSIHNDNDEKNLKEHGKEKKWNRCRTNKYYKYGYIDNEIGKLMRDKGKIYLYQ